MDWQTITALACVLATLGVFAWRIARPGSSNSSCGECSARGSGKKR